MSIANLTPQLPKITLTSNFRSSLQEPITQNLSWQQRNWSYVTKCPVIDRKFIEERVFVSDKNIHNKFVEIIENLIDSDPEVSEYVNFVFTNLEGFHINGIIDNLTSKHHIGGEGYGGFNAGYRIIFMRNSIVLNSPDLALSYFRHEFRHAYLNTIQIILNEGKSFSSSLISPNLPRHLVAAKQQELNQMLDAGISKMERYAYILLGFVKATKSEEDIIKKFNADLKKIDLQYYPITTIIIQEEKYKVGDKFLDGVVKSVKSHPTINGHYVLQIQDKVSYDNFLRKSLICFILEYKNTLKPYYSEIDKYLFEFDAHLIQLLPSSLREFFFLEFYNHINNFIKESKEKLKEKAFIPFYGQYFFPEINNFQGPQIHLVPDKIYELFIAGVPMFDREDKIFAIIELFFKEKNYQKVIKLSEKLISQGRGANNNSLAYRALAKSYWNLAKEWLNIKNYSNNENYKNSVKYFKLAEKNGVKLTSDENNMYSEALSKINLQKTADKVAKRI